MNLMELSDSFIKRQKCKTKVLVCIGLQYPIRESSGDTGVTCLYSVAC